MKVEMIEHKIEVIEEMFKFFNIAEDNLESNLQLNNSGIASINILAEFYLMLKSLDVTDFKKSRNIVDKFG